MYISIIESEQQIGCELSKSRNHPESGMMLFQVIWQSAMEYGSKHISIVQSGYPKNGINFLIPKFRYFLELLGSFGYFVQFGAYSGSFGHFWTFLDTLDTFWPMCQKVLIFVS